MRFTRGDVRTISFHPKSITDLRNGAKERCSRREAQRSTFARFLGLFDFRLLQQYRHKADISSAAVWMSAIGGEADIPLRIALLECEL
jgi:hypothetical protein